MSNGTQMIKIFLSRPNWVNSVVERQFDLLKSKMREFDMEPNTIGQNRLPPSTPFTEVLVLMRECKGAIILGQPLLSVEKGSEKNIEIKDSFSLPSEWNQIEAAVSMSIGLPTLMMRHKNIAPRGLFFTGSSNAFVHEYSNSSIKWIEDAVPKLDALRRQILLDQS